MTGNQTTILLLVALLALIFWLYNSKKLGVVVSAVTGNAPNPDSLTMSGSYEGNGLDSLPALGTLRIMGNGTSPLPVVNTSAIANERLFIHYDPATNKVFYSANP